MRFGQKNYGWYKGEASPAGFTSPPQKKPTKEATGVCMRAGTSGPQKEYTRLVRAVFVRKNTTAPEAFPLHRKMRNQACNTPQRWHTTAANAQLQSFRFQPEVELNHFTAKIFTGVCTFLYCRA